MYEMIAQLEDIFFLLNMSIVKKKKIYKFCLSLFCYSGLLVLTLSKYKYGTWLNAIGDEVNYTSTRKDIYKDSMYIGC